MHLTALWGGRRLALLASQARHAAVAAPLGRQQPQGVFSALLVLGAKALRGKRGQAPFAGTALRVLRTKGACPLFAAIAMLDFALSPAASQWTHLVLVWVGFGTLVGLLATVIFPFRRPLGPFFAVAAGIVGSTVGLLGLSWLVPDRELDPITPLGFLAATVGAFVLLVLYRIGVALFGKRQGDAEKQ